MAARNSVDVVNPRLKPKINIPKINLGLKESIRIEFNNRNQ